MSSEIIEIHDLDLSVEDNSNSQKEKAEIIDYKMVTFSLGGKDYGIDIMKVKEISKASKFTFVPNSIPFVKGVYNLRGDIISVIDLRVMFNLPVPETGDAPENMIILRLDDNVIGVIVDTIDKVIGISSSKIQPPHPLFGDINIKFIKGIVENDDKLYIILDVESIFDQKSADNVQPQDQPAITAPADIPKIDAPDAKPQPSAEEDVDYNFIVETLPTFTRFHVSELNETWVRDRYRTWAEARKAAGLGTQLKNTNDAEEFLAEFDSPYTGRFWEADYIEGFLESISETNNGNYSVWNVGCGKGEEAYSIAVALDKKFSSKRIKVHANDNDLLNISTAPNLIFAKNSIPELYDNFISEGKNGWHFTSTVKDKILFEYHDVTNDNQLPPVDLIVARDVLSYLSVENQFKLIDIFHEKLKPGGILIVGANECVFGEDWEKIENGQVIAYKKS